MVFNQNTHSVNKINHFQEIDNKSTVRYFIRVVYKSNAKSKMARLFCRFAFYHFTSNKAGENQPFVRAVVHYLIIPNFASIHFSGNSIDTFF